MISKVIAATAIILANAAFAASAQFPAAMDVAMPAQHHVTAITGPPWG